MKAKEHVMIKFIHTGGPFSDCTDNYDVITDAKTLGEFVNAILGRDTYQTFVICSANRPSQPDVCISYAVDGLITRKASSYDSLTPMKLKEVKVNGGWGNMAYTIWVDSELPTQDRKEFEMIYWGYTFDKK